MAAAPFKASLIFRAANGARGQRFCTVSDVNAAFYVFESGSSEPVINPSQDVDLVDVILSAAGTDTTSGTVFINGTSSGVTFLNATTLGSTVNRPFQMSPIRIAAGSQLRITQNT